MRKPGNFHIPYKADNSNYMNRLDFLAAYKDGQRDFTGVAFRGARLDRLAIRDCIFQYTDLQSTILAHSDLTGSNFFGADMRDTDLRAANLEHTILTNAKVGAELVSAVSLRGAEFHLDGVWRSGPPLMAVQRKLILEVAPGIFRIGNKEMSSQLWLGGGFSEIAWRTEDELALVKAFLHYRSGISPEDWKAHDHVGWEAHDIKASM